MSVDPRARLRLPVLFDRPRRARRLRTRAQAMVEFALILPVFLFLLVVAVDFGRLFFSYIQIHNGAREGANFGQGSPTDLVGITASVQRETNAQAQSGEGTVAVTATCADPAGTTIACALATGGAGPGNTVTVGVNRPFTFLTPLVNGFFGGTLAMDATATAIVLGYAPGANATQPPGCSTPAATFTVIVISGRTVLVNPAGSTPNSGICNISGYNWDWGDGETSVGLATGDTHTYATDNTYTVILEVTNQAGPATTSRSVTVPDASPTPTPTSTVGPTPTPTSGPTPTPTPTPVACTAPNPNFTWTTTGSGANKIYTYRDASTTTNPVDCAITGWLWTFTDTAEISSNAQNPAPFGYSNNSNHPVTLRVTNAAGQFADVTKNT